MTASGVSLSALTSALILAGVVPACSPRAPAAESSATRVGKDTAATNPAFTNRVWKVVESSAGDPGTLYVFLGDGTLLITSAHGTPSLGRWVQTGSGLTVIEEGIRYPADVLVLAADSFSIRMHSPGEPVTLTFAPAQ